MSEICTKCFRPKHTVSQVGGEAFVSCVEMPKDVIIFVENYQCGCCKCAVPPTIPEISELKYSERTARDDFLYMETIGTNLTSVR